ncbi:hypothetical protein ABZ756_07060 [Mammaliicoccus sciuri]
MTGTNAERLENMSPIGVDNDGNFLVNSKDWFWLQEQAERAQELEFTDTAIERRSLLNSLKECDEELTRWQTGQNMTGENYNEIRRLNIEKSRLREALEFYAEETRYMYKSRSLKGHPTIINDEGATARQALKGE